MSGGTLERLRWLLKGHTLGEWKVYKYWNGRLDVHSPTGEDDTCTSVITYPTAVDAELLALAPALGEALISSEARLEALTLERDRLAHELRLLQEAVHVPDLEAEQAARRAAEEAAVDAGLPYPCFQAQPAATRDCESDGYYMCEGCGLRIPTPEWAEAKERGRLFPLSSDTPERSGSDTFAGGEG